MAKVKFMGGHRCQRCGHEWFPRDKDQEPKVCPKCKSPYWNKPRKNEWTEPFTASVQYGNWHGTAAADDADALGIREFLRKKKRISDREFVVGVSLYVHENLTK